MKNESLFLRLAYCTLLMMPFMTMAEPKEEQRKILPYLQAEGYIDTVAHLAAIGWVDNTKIIYGVNTGNYKPEPENSLTDTDYRKSSQVMFFDSLTNKSEIYRSGQLISFRNNIVKIRLTETNPRATNVEKSTVFLKGSIGAEVEETEYAKNDQKSPSKCPSDVEEKPYVPIILKPEHGCIRKPDKGSTNNQWLYFRADGETISLNEVPYGSFRKSADWIDWLGVYIVGDALSMQVTRTNGPAINTPTIIMLNPDGKVKVIDMGIFGLQHTIPTRAGMVAETRGFYNGAFIRASNGLRLWRDGQIYHIATGEVSTAEVSPDGCKVAYVVELEKELLVRGRKSRLRVIDVCKAFGVAEDANPF